MKIYFAGRVSQRGTLQQWADDCVQLGHVTVSRWSMRESTHFLVDGLSPQAKDDERRRFAMEDIEDIDKADIVISLMEEPRGPGRGGRHVEFGYALARGKRLICVGPRETVFHHLINVEHFATWEECLVMLRRKPEPGQP
jgi:nucleoside 2-deoxyribosyltransferase